MEEKERKVKFPFRITGFDARPWPEDEKSYGIIVVPRKDFEVIDDKRLAGRYNGRKFSEVDEFDLPNFDSRGRITWYARQKGLSGLCLDWYLCALSNDGDLADSGVDGRVVLVRGVCAEGASEKI
ncbi:hypothetical protein HYV50_00120 [Candidatus Pacearchaeota archaeon]|nr:hypothetical protein [Candidatus Pacearchaeota archaeon]